MLYSETECLIQETASRFAREHLLPHAADFDLGLKRDVFLNNIKMLTEMGFSGLNISSQYGGAEAGSVAYAIAIEEIAYACASTAVTISINNMVSEVIHSVGTEDQKQEYLPKMNSAYRAGAFCLTEAGAGSDPAGLSLQAVKTSGGYHLNGTKIYITSGEYADLLVVWAKSDSSLPKGKGITCFLVPTTIKGVHIGKAEKKMGQNMSATNEIHFEDAFVPQDAILGQEHDGFRIAVKELTGGRIGIAALALGVARAALDAAISYAETREQFGQKLKDMQAIQWMLANSATEIEAAKLLIWQAAKLKQDGQPYAKEASMAKVYATEMAGRVTDTAIQVLGGAGYIKDYPVERYARDARITRIYEGTSEIQRLIIARHIFS